MLPLVIFLAAMTAEPAIGDPVVVSEWLVVAPADLGGREPFPRDPVFARYLLAPDAPAPRAGEEIAPGHAWSAAAPGDGGAVPPFERGYAFAPITSERERVVLASVT